MIWKPNEGILEDFYGGKRDENGVYLWVEGGVKWSEKWDFQAAFFRQTTDFSGLWGKQQWRLTKQLVIFIRL